MSAEINSSKMVIVEPDTSASTPTNASTTQWACSTHGFFSKSEDRCECFSQTKSVSTSSSMSSSSSSSASSSAYSSFAFLTHSIATMSTSLFSSSSSSTSTSSQQKQGRRGTKRKYSEITGYSYTNYQESDTPLLPMLQHPQKRMPQVPKSTSPQPKVSFQV